MADNFAQGQVIQVKPQPDIYTLLAVIAVVVLAGTIGVVLQGLLSADGYGLSIGEIFGALKTVS